MEIKRNNILQNDCEIQYRLAKVAELKGKTERAIDGYRKILNEYSNHKPSLHSLGEILIRLKRFEEACEIYRQALDFYPDNELFQKNHITSLIEAHGEDAAFSYFQLSRIDSHELSFKPNDILICCVVRNESPRLPFFLEYYRKVGIDKFLFVDNNSTDGTAEYLKKQSDVFLWQTSFSFRQANFGSAWFEVLLRKYGAGHWVLTVDADEIFFYPFAENKDIKQICAELDAKNKRAYQAILLDMYSDQSLSETGYSAGQDFFEVCPFFDRRFYHRYFEEFGNYKNQTFYFGGMRERIFGKQGDYLLSKIPLLKYTDDVVLAGGQHFTNLPENQISDDRGCLFHFKYFNFFEDYVRSEVNRNEHSCETLQYQQYQQKLDASSDLVFYSSRHSVKFRDSQQLIDLGVIKAEEKAKILKVVFPKITSLSQNSERPFWSIKITLYKRLKYLKEAIKSVLRATETGAPAEIEIINDAAEPEIQNQIKSIIDSIGDERIKFYSPAKNLGHPHIFNLCLNRANGHWVHLLHDDDLVHPDFYRCLEDGIKAAPKIGAAFSRFAYIDEAGKERFTSPLELQNAGIIENWLERISGRCRVQFPAIVVKRESYEKVGGFCPQAKSAFDWEMWKRLAASFPVWFEPEKLAFFREHSESLSYDLIRSGQQIADSRKTIEISDLYLPDEQKKSLARTASRELTLFAINQAERLLKNGDVAAAEANLRESLRCLNLPKTIRQKKRSNRKSN